MATKKQTLQQKREAVQPLLANLNQSVPGGGDAIGALLDELIAGQTATKPKAKAKATGAR